MLTGYPLYYFRQTSCRGRVIVFSNCKIAARYRKFLEMIPEEFPNPLWTTEKWSWVISKFSQSESAQQNQSENSWKNSPQVHSACPLLQRLVIQSEFSSRLFFPPILNVNLYVLPSLGFTLLSDLRFPFFQSAVAFSWSPTAATHWGLKDLVNLSMLLWA